MKFVCGNANRVVFQFSTFKSIGSEVILDRAECPLPMSTEDLSRIVSAIPSCVSSLQLLLKENDYFKLEEVFRRIPSHITSLTLAYTPLSQKSDDELVSIEASIPNNVIKIDWAFCGLSDSQLNILNAMNETESNDSRSELASDAFLDWEYEGSQLSSEPEPDDRAQEIDYSEEPTKTSVLVGSSLFNLKSPHLPAMLPSEASKLC